MGTQWQIVGEKGTSRKRHSHAATQWASGSAAAVGLAAEHVLRADFGLLL
jgi:hypothetical protein